MVCPNFSLLKLKHPPGGNSCLTTFLFLCFAINLYFSLLGLMFLEEMWFDFIADFSHTRKLMSIDTWGIEWWVKLAVVGRNTEHVVYGAVLALLQVVEGQGPMDC